MVSYPDYEEYYEYERRPRIELNANARFLIAISIVAVLAAVLFYSIGLQQGSVTTSVVKNTEEVEQPTYIDRDLDETRYGYYGYNYYDYYDDCYNHDYSCCSRQVPTRTYTLDCSIFRV